MKNPEQLTVNQINEMSYTDFVGLVNQWNVPPGAYETVNEWSVFGHVDQDSRVLEAACTTGFSLRELSLMTGCSGVGIDISAASVESANRTKEIHAPAADIDYRVENALTHMPDGEKYSHVMFGAALRFFPSSEEALGHFVTNLVQDRGFLLSNEFFTTKPIPAELIERAESVFNMTPTTVGYDEIMEPYKGLRRLHNQTHPIRQETQEQLDHYCDSSIARAQVELQLTDTKILEAMRSRLMDVKKMSNDLRPYQGYTTLVHQYVEGEYGQRYTELF